MVRTHTPEELAEAERILRSVEPQLKAFREAEKNRWANEIAMLERRVKEEYQPVQLGNGDTIALRTCLSEKEEIKLSGLIERWSQGDKKAAYEIVALVTANEFITVDWLKKNPDKFSVTDLLNVLFGMLEQRAQFHRETMERVRKLSTFRTEPARPKSGGLSPLHEDSGSEGLG